MKGKKKENRKAVWGGGGRERGRESRTILVTIVTQ